MAGCEAAVTIDAGWSPERLQELRLLYQPLRKFAAVVGRWDVEPDDLVQEAFANVLVRPVHEIRDLGAYLRRTIANLATNERRRVRRRLDVVHRMNGDGVGTAHDAYPSELTDLMRLDPQVRGLLYLVEVEGESIATAAATVGMSSGAARMALTRARRRLRAEMSTESTGE